MDKILTLINSNKWDKAYSILNKKMDSIIFDSNTFIHVCAIRGRIKMLLKIAKSHPELLLKTNQDGLNVLFLLLYNGYLSESEELIEFNPNLLTVASSTDIYPISVVIGNQKVLLKWIDMIISNKNEEQIKIIFNTTSSNSNDKSFVMNLVDLMKDTPNDIYFKLFIKIIPYIDFDMITKAPPLSYVIYQNKFKLAKYIINKNLGINTRNEAFYYPVHVAIIKDSYEIFKLLIENPVFDKTIFYHNPNLDLLPFHMILQRMQFKMIKLCINNKIDLSQFDSNRNIPAHIVSHLIYNLHKKFPKNISEYIFTHSDLDFKNLDKISPNDIINQNQNQTTTTNNNNTNPNEIVLSCPKTNSIILPEFTPNNNTGLFNSDLIHQNLYLLNLLLSYPDLAIPTIEFNESEQNKFLTKLSMQDIPYDRYYMMIRTILQVNYNLFYEMSPLLILWRSADLHWMDPHLKKCIHLILSNRNKRFILIKISILVSQQMTHANIILFDKKDNSYRRFEPTGINALNDELILDKKILEMIQSYTKTKIKYYRPGDYLLGGRFQAVSNDNLREVKKTGDPGGYCLAWCLWYVELKLSNRTLSESELIDKASDKIFHTYCSSKTPFNDFIRDYSHTLNNKKDSLLESFNIDRMDFYTVVITDENLEKIKIGVQNKIKLL
jgi:hypothetical protein